MATATYTPEQIETKVISEESVTLVLNPVEADYLNRLLASHVFGGSDVQHKLYLALSRAANRLSVPVEQRVNIEYRYHDHRGGDRIYATDPAQSTWPF